MAQNNSHWLKRVTATLVGQGWGVRKGRKHTILYPADKTKKPITVSTTPRCRFARGHAIRDITNAGGRL